MAVNKQAIKARIRSINATKKITSAMELISNAKLAKQRVMMERNKEYATLLKQTVGNIISQNPGIDNQFLKEKKSSKKLTIMFSSDLGLCGGYNSNMVKLACSILNKTDPLIVVGTKQRGTLKKRGFNLINEAVGSDNISFETLKGLINKAIDLYKNDEIGAIQLLYTEFINTVTFSPSMMTLIPDVTKPEKQTLRKETIFEPNANEILDRLIPMMIQNVTYSISLQTKTAEQASRRLAMENATDNAEELNEKLVLAYNQARQAAITQEITEIVAGADAL